MSGEKVELGMTVQLKGEPNDLYMLAEIIHSIVENCEIEFDDGEYGKYPILYNYENKKDVLYDVDGGKNG